MKNRGITPQHGLTCIDVFCGCGGFATGMLQAGWEIVAAIDHDPAAIATYYANLCDENTKIIGEIPRDHRKYFGKPNGYRYSLKAHEQIPPVRALFLKDIFDVSGWDMLNAAGVESVDVMIGSPPCQSFSKCNTQKRENDLRDFLTFEYGRLILEIDPGTLVMENVPQIIDAKLPDGRNIIDTFNEMMKRRDWELYYEIQAMYPEEVWKRRPDTTEQTRFSTLELVD